MPLFARATPLQVGQPHCRSRNSRATGIQNAVKSGQDRSPEQQFRRPMKIHIPPNHSSKSKNNPRPNRRQEKKTQQAQPSRSRLVQRAHGPIGIPKRQNRSGNKADRQKAKSQPNPLCSRRIASCRGEGPRLIKKIVRQEKNRLNHHDEANKTPTNSHGELDSPTRQLDCSYLLPRISMNPGQRRSSVLAKARAMLTG